MQARNQVYWAIEAVSLTKRFPKTRGWRALFSRDGLASPAVDHVDLRIKRGELFGLLGPNGAGKTTLIKMLGTLVTPTSGNARVNGFDLHQEAAIKASIGLVTSDERSFYWRLSGRQNLHFFASLHSIPPTKIPERVEVVLEQVGLIDVADSRFLTYSTGMRQRLSIARALLNRPDLLFLDEPTKGLDPTATQSLHHLIREQLTKSQGLTVFLTTHYLEEAEQLCDRIAIMHRGRIQACGTLSELRESLNLGDRYRIWVSGFQPVMQSQLEKRLSSLKVELIERPTMEGEGSSDQLAVIEFRSQEGDGLLDQAIDIVRSKHGTIQSVMNEKASLEAIFTHHTSQLVTRNDGQAISPVIQQEDDPPIPKNGKDPDLPSGASTNSIFKDLPGKAQNALNIALAFLRRDFSSEVSYRFSFFLQLFNIFFSVGVFYFISSLLGQAAAPYLTQYGGDYFSFVLIGIAFAGYFGVGLSSFSNSLRQAQTTGTLEAMLSTPTGISEIILSSSLWDYLLTTLRVLVYLVVGAAFLGVNLGSGNYPAALLILVLTVIAFSSLGIIAASFIMVLKRGDPVTWAMGALSSFLGGVYYPVEILPGWLQWISRLLPITYSLQAMRLALLQGASFAVLAPDILALAIFSVVLLPVSLLAFRFAVQRARIDGSLTQY
jgi:ABC-type multidrug transport system ATPase subunit/ABC-type multidrug transport system permease subunit